MGVTPIPSSRSTRSSTSLIIENKVAMLFKSSFIFFILASLLLLSSNKVTGISLRLNVDFESRIQRECYKVDMRGNPYPLGQINTAGPLGNSMENFISLIEKVEDYLGRNYQRPDMLARMFLLRFHIDELLYYPVTHMFHQEGQAKERNLLTEAMVDFSADAPSIFPEDALTPDEKCSLYYMLSHTINQTALPGDQRVYMAAARAPIIYPSSNDNSGRQAMNSRFNRPNQSPKAITGQVRFTEDAREQGVVGFRNNEVHAIAPARVLLGIVAHNARSQEISLSELAKAVNRPGENKEIKEGVLNVPLMTTLGDLWAYGATPAFSSDPNQRIGAKGKWNSTLCQVNYRLEHNYTRASLAEIRGAIDGFLIGKKVAEILKDAGSGQYKLSSFLRQYYSPSGLFDEFTNVCNRGNINTELTGLKEQVKQYLRVWHPVAGILMNEWQQNEMIDKSDREWQEALRLAYQIIPEDQEWCRPNPNMGGNNGGICETKSDVVVVIDTEQSGTLDAQMEIITRLSNELDMRRFGSSITILANTKGGGIEGSADGLSRIAWNSTNRGCPNCALSFMDKSQFGYGFRNTPDIFYRAANNSLRDLKLGTKDQLYANGRPMVVFEFSSYLKKPTGDRRAFDSAQWDMKNSHRDVPLLLVGPPEELEIMKGIVYDTNSDVFTVDPDVTGVTQKLSKRICETPAVIQHPRCRSEPSVQSTFSGFISRGRKQYWAMYPEFFLKSYNVAFEIKAITGPIKVCYRRGYPKPEEDERNCMKLDPSGQSTHIMRSANPCYKFDLYSCPPFYFTIIGLNEGGTATQKCKSKYLENGHPNE
jgi:hypothetical protein